MCEFSHNCQSSALRLVLRAVIFLLLLKADEKHALHIRVHRKMQAEKHLHTFFTHSAVSRLL